ncbi:FRG domain-containing protein [Subtercola boreus]|nr:FRG domain-containing protein [Subtercola boreus]
MDALKLPVGYQAAIDALDQLAKTSAAIEHATKLPVGYQAAIDALDQFAKTSAAIEHATKLPTGYQAAIDALDQFAKTSAAIEHATQLPTDYQAATDRLKQLTGSLSVQIPLKPMPTSLKRLGDIYTRPALGDWTEALDRTLGPAASPKPRRLRTAATFFAAFETQIHSLPEILRALAVMQEKNSRLRLVWRGQQDANWSVDSSLTRRLRADGHELGEEQMIAVERFQMAATDRWANPRTQGDLDFLAELQHEGVPTRLIDVSLDPEVAVWFAVQESEEQEDSDARLLAWGRSAAPKRNSQVEEPLTVPAVGGEAFWHSWRDKETRLRNQWGTGKAVPSWQPATLNERMRAQRAAFLFDADPIIDSALLEMFNKRLNDDWQADEISGATRVIGFPSPHDKRAESNSARIVPMFSLRIMAAAKPQIRSYLKSKGLVEESIYPDRAGLISYLRRMGAQ